MTGRLAEVLEWRTRRERSERSVRNRTSPFSFTGDCIHPSLLRRGATEPPESLPTPSTRSTYSTRPNLSAHSASLRLCVKNLPSRSARSTCSTRPNLSAHSAPLRLCVKNPQPTLHVLARHTLDFSDLCPFRRIFADERLHFPFQCLNVYSS